jgi:hypothetical protein
MTVGEDRNFNPLRILLWRTTNELFLRLCHSLLPIKMICRWWAKLEMHREAVERARAS